MFGIRLIYYKHAGFPVTLYTRIESKAAAAVAAQHIAAQRCARDTGENHMRAHAGAVAAANRYGRCARLGLAWLRGGSTDT